MSRPRKSSSEHRQAGYDLKVSELRRKKIHSASLNYTYNADPTYDIVAEQMR